MLEPDAVERGKSSSRKVAGNFSLRAQAVIVASGGIGGNHDLVRQNWPKRLGEAPKNMISGVPEHVDGRMIGITEAAGARLINRDRMWHYVEGIRNWSPIWPRHGIRILPGPSSMWFDAIGQAAALAAVSRLRHARAAALHHVDRLRLFVVRADPEHHQEGIRPLGLGAESGSDGKKLADDRAPRHQQGRASAGGSVQGKGADFIVRDNLGDLVSAMNALAGDNLLKPSISKPRSRRATARSKILTSRTRR